VAEAAFALLLAVGRCVVLSAGGDRRPLYEALAEINRRGVAMLIVDPNLERGKLAERVYLFEEGGVEPIGTHRRCVATPRSSS
jgi:hypothetical protein